MKCLEIIVPGTPIAKGRPRFVKETGRAFTPEKTYKYENLVALHASEAMAGRDLFAEAIRMEVLAFMPIPKSWSKVKQMEARMGTLRPETKPDLDNLAKVVDALNEVVWDDDKRIVETVLKKFYDPRPRLVIRVRSYFGRSAAQIPVDVFRHTS